MVHETMGRDRVKNQRYAVDFKFEEQKDKVIISLLDKKQSKKAKALDCGAGDGRFARKLKALGYDAYACDLDVEFYKAKDIPFKKADFSKSLPYPSNTFDVVICREVIEHVENQWILMREINRILKQGGIVIIETPNPHTWISKFIFLFTDYFNFFYSDYIGWIGHTHPLFVWNLKRMAKDNYRIEKLFFPFAIIPLLRIKLPFKSKWFGDSLIAKLRKVK
ncbi:class I SAM-dependent methyltransferase [Candidatus Woesearchaeota archaeon]|nr:class I SAM-dependent methyltransferase [Candidatus Woesearchaeota archaeon]